MCGLAGIARFGGGDLDAPRTQHLLHAMTETIAHRGPDAAAFLCAGPVGLGFVRLSLVDPEGGGQPLSTPDGSVSLIANGEIYNHRELAAGLPAGMRPRTGSDCEVLLYLYLRDGEKFLDNVRGMFSFVLWDRTRNRLLFARDRFGIKPLFFHVSRERIVFASEIKALFDDADTPRELDWDTALSDQLMTADPVVKDGGLHSWFTDIELAPTASIVTFDLDTGQRRTHKYWSFPEFDGDSAESEEGLIRRYAEILASSVDDCQMADVEVGLFLSGGVDSAAVAALAGNRPRTFTALNASTLRNTDAEFGHRIAAHLGLSNSLVSFDTDAVPGVQEWRRHLWQLETPLAGPESFYKYEMYRYVGAHAPEIKAMMLGGGADEFNGGYSVLMAGGGDWSDFTSNIDRMGVRAGQHSRADMGFWWDHPGLPLVTADALADAAGGQPRSAYEMFFRSKYRDVQMYNCWHEDRTAAGNGIEARVPFLDHRLVELVAAVPDRLRPSLIWNKQILRRGLDGVLPPEFANRPKIPFYYGEGVDYTHKTFTTMLLRDGGALVDEALSGRGASRYLDADNIRSTLRTLEHRPMDGYIQFVLRLVNLGLLESMTGDLPRPLQGTVKAPVPLSVSVDSWDEQAEEIEAAIVRPRSLDPQAVLDLGPDVLLLNSPDIEPLIWYVVVDGAIAFVVDEKEEPAWVAVLRALDGVRTLQQIAAELALSTLEPLGPLIDQATDAGIVAVLAGVGR